MIIPTIELSSGHLSRDTVDLLEGLPLDILCGVKGWPAMQIAPYIFGWFITTPEAQYLQSPTNLPEDLWRVLNFASIQGADIIRLDSEGRIENSLPHYDW
jgi:hypothetical protein